MNTPDDTGGTTDAAPATEEWLESLHDPGLEALLDAERSAPGPPPGALDAVWAGLESQAGNLGDPREVAQMTSAGSSAGPFIAALGAGAVVVVALFVGLSGSEEPEKAALVAAPSLPTAAADVVASPEASASLALEGDASDPAPPSAVAMGKLVLTDDASGQKEANTTASEAETNEAKTAPAERTTSGATKPVTPAPTSAKEGTVADNDAQPTIEVAEVENRASAQAATPEKKLPTKKASKPSERSLLDAAHSALNSGRASVAIARARDHRRYYPRGSLTQEREALWVRALVSAGRHKQALKRGAGFMKRFPRSLHGRAVKAALAKIEAKTPSPD